jgi:hypothetical protein
MNAHEDAFLCLVDQAAAGRAAFLFYSVFQEFCLVAGFSRWQPIQPAKAGKNRKAGKSRDFDPARSHEFDPARARQNFRERL